MPVVAAMCPQLDRSIATIRAAPHAPRVAPAAARSLRLDVGGAHDLAPGFHLRLDAGGKILGRAGDNLEAERRQALLHVRQRETFCDLVAKLADDRPRR